MRKRTSWKGGLLWAAVSMVTTGAAVAQSGEDLAQACASCHGATGVSTVSTMPIIAGFEEAYFVDIMLAYKHGHIESPMMAPFAKPYDKAQFEAMAGFYARHPYQPADQKFDPDLATRGEAVHVEYCGICHKDGGSIEAARQWSLPPLAGQWKPYLRTALKAFVDGKRPMSDGKAPYLKALMAREGDEGVDALMDYYASQQ